MLPSSPTIVTFNESDDAILLQDNISNGNTRPLCNNFNGKESNPDSLWRFHTGNTVLQAESFSLREQLVPGFILGKSQDT